MHCKGYTAIPADWNRHSGGAALRGDLADIVTPRYPGGPLHDYLLLGCASQLDPHK